MIQPIPTTFLRDGEPTNTGGGASTTTSAPSATPPASFNPFSAESPAPTTTAPVATATTPDPVKPAAEAPATTTAPVANTPPPQTPPSTTVGLTPDQLQALIAAARGPSVNGQPPPTPPMSEADFKKAFNIFEATPELYEQLLGVKPDSPARVEALNTALQNLSKQSVTIARYLMEQKFQEMQRNFDSRLQPVAQSHEEQVAAKHFNEFTAEYPALKDYGPLLKEIVTAAQARGTKFTSLAETKSFVAAQAVKLLGKDLTWAKTAPAASPGAQAPAQQPVTRQMSTMSMGGRSGSSGSATPAQSTAERLFANSNA